MRAALPHANQSADVPPDLARSGTAIAPDDPHIRAFLDALAQILADALLRELAIEAQAKSQAASAEE